MDYQKLNAQLSSLCEGVKFRVTLLSNAAALLYNEMEGINWAGFYLAKDGDLYLGPFQGKPACTFIAAGRGVCGAAAAQGKTLIVPDVHTFPGHIACDPSSRSEIVLPLKVGGRLWGVLDVDAPTKGRFDESDRRGLEEFTAILEKTLEETAGF